METKLVSFLNVPVKICDLVCSPYLCFVAFAFSLFLISEIQREKYLE